MSPLTIDHIGFLVADLEDAIERWSTATGFTFSPIARYRTQTWTDSSDPQPHWHDARIAFSREGSPAIELMEFHGEGTHSEKEGEGFHHIAFMNVTDIEERQQQLALLGFSSNGQAVDEDGNVILWFTDKKDLDNVRLEYVSAVSQPIVADDGEALPPDEQGKPDLWASR
jgi:catechol 2,3-dioxygenase-like lactoylglutathione lyase family enzyme